MRTATNPRCLQLAIVLLIGLLGVASCGGPTFLGARIPAFCEHDTVRCRIWAGNQGQFQGGARIVHMPKLQRYLQATTDRLIRANMLPVHPTVRLVFGSDFAIQENWLNVSVSTLAGFESEAELAGVLAHELVHLVGAHASVAIATVYRTDLTFEQRQQHQRNLEQIADERAVAILVKAGYVAHGLFDALRTLLNDCAPTRDNGFALDDCDSMHPAYATRLASVAIAQAKIHHPTSAGPEGFERRDEFLAAIDGLPLQWSDQLVEVPRAAGASKNAPDAYVHHASGLGLDVAASTAAHVYTHAFGRLIASTLVGSTQSSFGGRSVVQGFWPTKAEQNFSSAGGENRDHDMGRVMRSFALDNFNVHERDYVAIVFTRAGALVLWAEDRDVAAVKNAVASVHPVTAAESAAEKRTLRIRQVTKAGRWADVGAATCHDGIELEPGDRHVAVGDKVKCSER